MQQSTRRRRTSARRRARLRRRLVALAVALLVVAAVAMAILALPLLAVQEHANEAKSHLVAAKAAIQAGDAKTARDRVGLARGAVDEAQHGLTRFGPRVWSKVPIAGGAVDDVDHLLDALDHSTTMAEIGVDVFPSLNGSDTEKPLFDGERVNLPLLRTLIERGHKLGEEAVAADKALDAVDGSIPFLGSRISGARDEAAETVSPIADGYRTIGPSLDVLPRALGGGEHVRYLITIMNPAELRWSGGATLTMSVLDIEDGRTSLSRQVMLSDALEGARRGEWEPVEGNPFHYPGEDRVANATFNPDWPVSAEELQRAWSTARGTPPVTGVIALDLPALSQLLTLTGPLEVEGVGTVTGDTLVETLAGSYDKSGPRAARARHRLNMQLAEVFRSRLLAGGQVVEKGQVLGDAATGRHLAMWSSDPAVQEAFSGLGLTGELGDAGRDYLGVFTQNSNGSKTDYFQKRSLESQVELHEDGSARVRLSITLDNDTPPYSGPGKDRRRGYATRYNKSAVLQLLPEGATLRRLHVPSADGTVEKKPQAYDDRPFYRHTLFLQGQEQETMTVEYDVPNAAVVDGDTLTYRLVYDPQGMVTPQSLKVSVSPPDGFSAGDHMVANSV